MSIISKSRHADQGCRYPWHKEQEKLECITFSVKQAELAGNQKTCEAESSKGRYQR